MNQFIGVKPRHGFDPLELKREALMFHKIAVPKDPNPFYFLNGNKDDDRLNVPDWLYDESILFEPRFSYSEEFAANEEYVNNFDLGVNASNDADDELRKNPELNGLVHWAVDQPIEKQKEILKQILFDGKYAHLKESFLKVSQHFITSDEYRARAMSIQLRDLESLDACPILVSDLTPTKDNQTDIIQVVLNELPVPDDSVSWDDIREFRNNSDSINKFTDLRRWMNKFAKGNLAPNEAKEEVEYLLSEYKNTYLKQRKIKVRNMVFGATLQLGAAFLDKKWGPIATGLVLYATNKLGLLEGESKSSGREVAYIIKAKEAFK